MKDVFGSKKPQGAQTLVFFLLAFGVILLLCGLAIDSGLLYLAKARMGRAVDGAVLAAVGNFHRSNDALTNRDNVAIIMRNFAVANYTDLSSVSSTISTSGGSPVSGQSNTYVYNFDDTSGSDNFNGSPTDSNGQFKRFVQCTLTVGNGGGIISATCNARCPVHTYFIGYADGIIGGFKGISSLKDLKVSSSAVATRNPRLIMVVIDRSASMLSTGGGAYTLPSAVVEFLDFFDTTSDNIGIVSFGSSARLEMPLTTNFIYAGTNVLTDDYQTNSVAAGVPGVDPEQESSDANSIYYASGGVRRMKFGGQTAADDGIRLAMETMMANSSFTDPDVLKYMVLFTDGKWNQTRTLFAAPGYTNEVDGPPAAGGPLADGSYVAYVTNSSAMSLTNGAAGIWTNDMTQNTAILPVPIMSPMPYVTNAIIKNDSYSSSWQDDYSFYAADHLNDYWQSIDSSGVEPLPGTPGSTAAREGAPAYVSTNTWVGYASTGSYATNYYTRNLDVWLQPGSVDYLYTNGATSPNPSAVFVSNYNNPTQHINITLTQPTDKNVLVVPGYIVDGLAFDTLDLTEPDDLSTTYARYRSDNYQQPYMWTDDTASIGDGYYTGNSMQRQLMFRNYINLLTGFYVFRADEPNAAYTPSNPVNFQGIEPLITDTTDSPRPYYGLGAYYPSAGFYWPFDLVGLDVGNTFALRDPTTPIASDGSDRHIAYSINMLSTAAAPEWYGELFYKGTGGTSVTSGTANTSVSSVMVTSDWKTGAPSWVSPGFDQVMTSDAVHDTNVITSPSTWRPSSYNGSAGGSFTSTSSILPDDALNYTGGYVTDGAGKYYRNAMAWSGRPTHYYDFSQSKWVAVANNHVASIQFLPLGYWKAQEYAWHARASGVTIYTVGYGTLVSPQQQVILAQIANSTNTTAGNSQTYSGGVVSGYVDGPGTSIVYNPSQPIGREFYATTTNEIYSDFESIGQAINASLTQ